MLHFELAKEVDFMTIFKLRGHFENFWIESNDDFSMDDDIVIPSAVVKIWKYFVQNYRFTLRNLSVERAKRPMKERIDREKPVLCSSNVVREDVKATGDLQFQERESKLFFLLMTNR